MAAFSCCPAGSLPALVEDTSRTLAGTVLTLPSGGEKKFTCYVAKPPNGARPKGGIVVVYDVHGFSGGRIKGVCDQLASEGFMIIMPDVYHGTNITEQGGFGSETGMAFLKGKDWPSLEPELDACIKYLKDNGVSKVGALGFCWGAWPVFKLSSKGAIDAGCSCHPSLVVGKMLFNETEESQAKSVKCPIMLMPASNDPQENYGEGGDVTLGVRGAGFECKTLTFPDMKHGWVPRGNAKDDPAVRRDVAQALGFASTFFSSHL